MKRARDRLAREEATIEAMIGMRCRRLHTHEGPDQGSGQGRSLCPGLCPECGSLLAYARKRLAACSWGAAKPVCGGCPRHCYRPAERALIRQVMAWSGPRMLLSHPLLALAHLADTLRSRRSAKA